ncbi:hypothetical protein SCHPADRAFT_907198 [Schizopora paradoxa]|uniref:Uncharacterized protein n=1 Tax=Schizopora paradoxa TaxID=27342 RepID=A0A0H2REV5_9AGAM|nr:hypothetical protein SCHPADRAFT_907198 [Schizopora paradoxa]
MSTIQGESPFKTFYHSVWKKTTSFVSRLVGANEHFPWPYISGEELSLRITIALWGTIPISFQERLFLKEIWLYKRLRVDGALAHDFLVFAVYDSESIDTSRPIAYVRLEHVPEVDEENENENESKEGGSSVVPTARDNLNSAVAEPKPAPTPEVLSSTDGDSPSPHPILYFPHPGIQVKFSYHETLARALKGEHVSKYHQAVLFAESDHVDPWRLLALASIVGGVASGYNNHDSNLFTKMMLELAARVELLGGKAEEVRRSKSSKVAHPILLPPLKEKPTTSEYDDLYKRAKESFLAKWAELEEKRQNLQNKPEINRLTAENDDLRAQVSSKLFF